MDNSLACEQNEQINEVPFHFLGIIFAYFTPKKTHLNHRLNRDIDEKSQTNQVSFLNYGHNPKFSNTFGLSVHPVNPNGQKGSHIIEIIGFKI